MTLSMVKREHGIIKQRVKNFTVETGLLQLVASNCYEMSAIIACNRVQS